MENKYIRHTDDEWLSIINECRTSGCSHKFWCQDHNITLSTFYYQIRRLRKKACCIPEPVNSSAKTQEVVQLDFSEQYAPLPSSVSPLPEVRAAKTETAVRITFRGIQIEITNAAANDTVYHTLSALQRLC